MRKPVYAAAVLLSVFGTSAFAANLSIKGSVSQSLDGSDNYFLSNAPLGTTYKSTSRFKLDALAQTPTTRYLLDGNFSYYDYFGPGADQANPTNGTPAGATFRIDHTTELTKYNLAMSWQRHDLSSILLTQTGFANVRGSADTYQLSGGFVHDLSRLDSISLQTRATKATYTNSNQTPYIDVSPTLTWTHRVNPTTNLTSSVIFDWFSADDPANSQRLFWQIVTGVTSRLTKRLTFSASVETSFVNAYQANNQLNTTFFQFQPGATEGFFGNVQLTYQLFKTTSVSWTAARTLTPTILGQLQSAYTLGFAVNHQINHFSSLAASMRFAHASLDGVVSDFWSAHVGYDYMLTHDWQANLSYTYRQRNNSAGVARASSVLFRLTRNFTALGNPNVFNEAEQERASRRKQEAVGQVFPVYH